LFYHGGKGFHFCQTVHIFLASYSTFLTPNLGKTGAEAGQDRGIYKKS
jgi:hypothetical protein